MSSGKKSRHFKCWYRHLIMTNNLTSSVNVFHNSITTDKVSFLFNPLLSECHSSHLDASGFFAFITKSAIST